MKIYTTEEIAINNSDCNCESENTTDCVTN